MFLDHQIPGKPTRLEMSRQVKIIIDKRRRKEARARARTHTHSSNAWEVNARHIQIANQWIWSVDQCTFCTTIHNITCWFIRHSTRSFAQRIWINHVPVSIIICKRKPTTRKMNSQDVCCSTSWAVYNRSPEPIGKMIICFCCWLGLLCSDGMTVNSSSHTYTHTIHYAVHDAHTICESFAIISTSSQKRDWFCFVSSFTRSVCLLWKILWFNSCESVHNVFFFFFAPSFNSIQMSCARQLLWVNDKRYHRSKNNNNEEKKKIWQMPRHAHEKSHIENSLCRL